MKKITLLIALIGISFGMKAQEETVNGSLTVKGSVSLRTAGGSGTAGFDLSGNGNYIHVAGLGLISRLNNQQDLGIDGYKFRNLWLGSNAYIDGNVGIGTSLPNGKLDIRLGGWNNFARITFNQTFDHPSIRLYRPTGNADGAYPWWIENNKNLSFKSGSTASVGSEIVIDIMTLFSNGNVGIGTTDTKGFKLGVKGKIAVEEVKVAIFNNWSDFVFENSFELPTLDEVEQHIKEKGHLKDIPSAKEVEENGIYLGEMDAKLLQKIEELTLYTIAQEKKIKSLEKQNLRIEKLENENTIIKTLTERLTKIENQLHQ